MQPEINPNYLRQQYPNYQQMIPSYYGNQYNQIAGRYVNDFNEITPNEIPMNGQGAIFIKLDLSEMAIKKWEQNGTISTRLFKPFYEPTPNNDTANTEKAENDTFKLFLGAFESEMKQINDKLDKLSKPSRAKKEADDE